MKKFRRNQRDTFLRTFRHGFTLIEMIVAFGLFAVIMVVSVGSLLSLMQANYKAQSLKTVVNNLHFAFENISRNLRVGTNYHCNVLGGDGNSDLSSPSDCPNESAPSIVFTTQDGSRIFYRQKPGGTLIERVVQERDFSGSYPPLPLDADYIPITAPEIEVEQLQFFVKGTSPTDNTQPQVLILAKGSMRGRGKVLSRFIIQTMVSQRQLDVAP